MDDGTKELKIRLPATLHERLSRAAERDHRSRHAQMVHYIVRGVDADEKKENRRRTSDV